MIETAIKEFPNFKVTATTLRAVKTATVNDWGAISWAGGNFYEAVHRPELEIMDRVGGGDSFASGLIYGYLSTGDPDKAVNYGAAHGALAMTTPGDTTMVTVKEWKIVAGEVVIVVRGVSFERLANQPVSFFASPFSFRGRLAADEPWPLGGNLNVFDGWFIGMILPSVLLFRLWSRT